MSSFVRGYLRLPKGPGGEPDPTTLESIVIPLPLVALGQGCIAYIDKEGAIRAGSTNGEIVFSDTSASTTYPTAWAALRGRFGKDHAQPKRHRREPS